MRDKILRFCRREQLLSAGEPVVCALSGGADSAALLHVLLQLQPELGFSLSAAHFNHCLRGAESDADEAFVRQLCQSCGVPLTVGRGDCAAFAGETGQSLEEAARSLRYEFLFSQKGLIATAHHADDQTETVLLNLLRGTGLRGLAGMAPRQDRLVRPMLSVTRREIEDYLAENGLSHREDSSNFCDDARRNRLRHHVIPLLQAENPGLSATVSRMTGLLQQEDAYLTRLAQQVLEQASRETGWDCRILRKADPVLRRRAIRLLLEIPKPSMAHVEQVERLLEDLSGSACVCLTGQLRAVREYDLLRLEPVQTAPAAETRLLQPGEEVCLPWAGGTLRLEPPAVLTEVPPDCLALPWEAVRQNGGVTVRSRRTGDRLRLSGGSKTLKALMIDRKIPASCRDRVPVLELPEGLAVIGLGCDRALWVNPGETAVIIRFFHEEREK